MSKSRRAWRQRNQAQPELTASSTLTDEILLQPEEPQESQEPEDNPDPPDSPEAPALSGAELEAALAEREQIGYLRGRAEAVEASWVDPVNPSTQSLRAMARMGIPVDNPELSPFAGRKSVWDPIY